MGLILDTDVLIARERDSALAARIRAEKGPRAIATITVAELLAGAHLAGSRATRARNRREAERVIATVEVLPFDLAVARRHARAWAALEKKGKRTGDRDLIIAATALTHGYRLATLNPKHFRHVPGLRLVPLRA
jgi:predicted nucleic acid-binding protein